MEKLDNEFSLIEYPLTECVVIFTSSLQLCDALYAAEMTNLIHDPIILHDSGIILETS